MLAPSDKFRCIECGKPFGMPGFAYHHGNPDDGPAYFSDRGVLCSAQCSLTHYRKRRADGTAQAQPARNPMTGDFG